MPPGMIHIVHTIVASWMHGLHYLSFHTMHFTLVSHLMDHRYPNVSTNTSHPSVLHYVARMILYLSLKDVQIPQVSLVAMCTMVLWPLNFVDSVTWDAAKDTIIKHNVDQFTQQRAEWRSTHQSDMPLTNWPLRHAPLLKACKCIHPVL